MSIKPQTIREVMAALGSRTSERKAESSRSNGKLGGRPKGSKSKPKDSLPYPKK